MSVQSIQGNAVRTLSPVHDWTYGNGLAGYLQGNAAIGQQIDCRLQLFLGEVFWATNEGIDWFGWLGGKNPAGLNLAISTVILNSYGVLGLNGNPYVVNDVLRTFQVKWDVTTVFSKSFPGTSTLTIGG